MRTTVELSDRTYARLRARAAEVGMRGFSPIVEEALERLLDQGPREDELSAALTEAEGTWSAADVEDWERSRREAWKTWPSGQSSIPTS